MRINRTETAGLIGFTLILEITPTSQFSALNNLDLNSEESQFITIADRRAFFDFSQSFNLVPSGELTQCRDSGGDAALLGSDVSSNSLTPETMQ